METSQVGHYDPSPISESLVAIKKIWLNIAAYYSKDVSKEMVVLYADDTRELSPKELISAFKRWRRANTKFPLPADLMAIARPNINADDHARLVAGKIIEAVGKFGSYNGLDAKTWLGEAGWSVVERFGGWGYLCANLGEKLTLSHFVPQARDLAKSQFALKKISDAKKMSLGEGSGVAEVNRLMQSTLEKTMIPCDNKKKGG